MGLPADLVADLENHEPPAVEVWPDNMPIIDAWLVVCTQWRTEGLATGQVLWIGLDYGAVDRGLDRAGMVLTPSQWSSLRMMERVASAALNGNRG